MKTDELLALCSNLEEKAKAATPLPWLQCMAQIVGADSIFVAELVTEQLGEIPAGKINSDGRFIAAAANSIPTLTAEVRRLVEENGRLESGFLASKVMEYWRNLRAECDKVVSQKDFYKAEHEKVLFQLHEMMQTKERALIEREAERDRLLAENEKLKEIDDARETYILRILAERKELVEGLEKVEQFDDKNFKANSDYDKGLGVAYSALGSIARQALERLGKGT